MNKFEIYLKQSAIDFDRSLYDNVTSSYMRSMFIHKVTILLLKHLELQNKPTTYLRNAKKILNDCGYFHLSELARKLNIPKQTLSYTAEKLPKENIIELKGKKYIKWPHGKMG